MKYGIREICEVVLRAKDTTQIGKKIFFKDEPVMYFDTLKTSSFEGSSTTVYAQGGRGNVRLLAWDGEKTMTFTMEDALISPEGLMVLTGAGLIEAGTGDGEALYQHMMERVNASKFVVAPAGEEAKTINPIPLSYEPVDNTKDADNIYVMLVKDGEIISEPYIGTKTEISDGKYGVTIGAISTDKRAEGYTITEGDELEKIDFDSVIVDYYVAQTSSDVKQIEITAESFGCNFYLEADTLFRNEKGIDVPATFVIPNCKIQSNFNFSMSGSGDPSTFTFTLDCFPDYTRWNKEEKVIAAIQIIPKDAGASKIRLATDAGDDIGALG